MASITTRANASYVADAPSTVASGSGSSVSSDRRHIGAMSTSVSRNISSGNAVQINGPVAGKIYNLNFQNLVVNCQYNLSTEISTHGKDLVLPSQNPPKTPDMSTSGTETRKPITRSLVNSDLDNLMLPSQYLTLYTKSSERPQIVRAVYRPTVSNNFIARRIVRRLELKTDNDSSIVKPLIWGTKCITPTGDYVDLACFAEGCNDGFTCRLYVVKRCPFFDLLFGSDTVNSSRC
ncbi:Nn.00g041840.m01.CDS01 [Neocucurbitaria sp. VM-36]